MAAHINNLLYPHQTKHRSQEHPCEPELRGSEDPTGDVGHVRSPRNLEELSHSAEGNEQGRKGQMNSELLGGR